MGKRGRPPKVKQAEDYTWNANDTGERAEEMNLMKVEDAAHLTRKNGRTMMKVMQLMDVMNNPGAEDLDTHRLVQAKIEKYKKRINRRLRKLAEWSDEKVEDRRLYGTERRKKFESTYKQVYAGAPRVELKTARPSYNEEGRHQDVGSVYISPGCVNDYSSEYNKILANHGEAGSKGSTPAGNTSIVFRTSEFVPPAGKAPAIAVNDPYRGLKEGNGMINVKPERFEEIYKYIPEPDLKDVPENEAKKRRKVDNAHKRSMKELVNKLTGQPPPPWVSPDQSSSSKASTPS